MKAPKNRKRSTNKKAAPRKTRKQTAEAMAQAEQKRQRATEAELAGRVQEVLQARLNGASFHDLEALAREREWNVCERQLWRYVQLSDEAMQKHFEDERSTLLTRHVLQRRRLYATALQDGDMRTALAVLRDEAELENLYPRKKIELTGKDGGPVQTATVELTDDERRDAIAAIFARVGASSSGQGDSGQRDGAGPAMGTSGEAPNVGRDDTGPLADEVDPLIP